MNLELYRAFYFTAKYGTISKASENLFITQPAVSRSIRQLEDSLKCSLFFRTPKGVKLTQEGAVLFEHIEQAFSFISSGERKINDMKNLLEGEIRIGVSDTLCKHYLVPFLKLFNTYHPAIRFQVICPTTPGIISLLKAGKIDFGIINMPFQDEQLEFKSVMEVQDCFVTGRKYRHLNRKMQPLSEILQHPLLLLEKNSSSRRFMDQYFSQNGLSPEPAFELGNIDLLIQFAKYDFGIACVIKNFIGDELEKGMLFEVKPIEKIPPRSVGVTWLKHVPLTSAAREFIRQLDYPETSEI